MKQRMNIKEMIDRKFLIARQEPCFSTTEAGASAEQGMYLYALIADGTVVDTKRMVLTK